MKKTTLLAYRNNNTWQELHSAVLKRATADSVKNGTDLLMKVFAPSSQAGDIDAWIDETRANHDITHFVADDTVAERLTVKGFSLKEFENYRGLNSYLKIQTCDTFKHIPVDQLYSTCFARLAEVVQPDLWVIVSNHIADYDPLGMFPAEKSDEDVTDEERAAYIEKFKGFVPQGQSVSVFTLDWKRRFCHEVVKDKKVIVLCHHHAKQSMEKEPLGGTVDGSLWLDTYPSAIIRDLVPVIQTDDLIGGDVLDILRKRLEE